MLRTFTTRAAPRGARLDYWQETVCRTLVGVQCQPGSSGFSGRIGLLPAGASVVCSLTAVGHHAVRDRRHIEQTGDDFDMLFLQIAGEMTVSVGGRAYTIAPGDFYFHDGHMPYGLHLKGPFCHLVRRVPRAQVEARMRAIRQLGSFRLPGTAALPRVAAATFRELLRAADSIGACEAGTVANAILELFLSSVRQSHFGATAGTLGSSKMALLLRAKAAVKAQLSDPDLAPRSIARKVGVTERYLNRLLEGEGKTLRTLILEERLSRAAADLADPMQAARTITEIAFGNGFSDSSVFARAFRKTIGCAPRDYRADVGIKRLN